MRSLTLKLVLAFLLTSVAGIVLAAFFIRQLLTSEFDDYVSAQRRTAIAELIGEYYAANGSWDGLDAWLREHREPPPARMLSPDATQPAEAPQIAVAPVDRGEGFQRGRALRTFFIVADAEGKIVTPFETYTVGMRVAPAELASGAPIVVDGKIVGTVITPRAELIRDPAERRFLSRADLALAASGGVVVVIALLLGFALARVITRPVRELTSAAGAIGEGRLRQILPVRSRDELGQLTAQFNRMSADLAHANQLRRQMTADIAHDLRTPLTVIAGYLESLRDHTLKPTAERFTVMHNETQLLLRLVEDLHTLSLADAGDLPLNRQVVGIDALLERVVQSYQHPAEQSGVKLVIQSAGPQLQALVDVEQIGRVLGNLVSNALRYTPRGGQIMLGAAIEAGAADMVALTVADTGAGIAPEHLPKIFERFYRADQSRTRETGGSGLGLAIVRSIIEAHGGQVRIQSTLGQGTRFTLLLPQP